MVSTNQPSSSKRKKKKDKRSNNAGTGTGRGKSPAPGNPTPTANANAAKVDTAVATDATNTAEDVVATGAAEDHSIAAQDFLTWLRGYLFSSLNLSLEYQRRTLVSALRPATAESLYRRNHYIARSISYTSCILLFS